MTHSAEQGTPDNADPDMHPGVADAVRARALDRVRQEQEQPKPSTRHRLQVLLLTLVAVSVVFFVMNWVVTGMHRIMDIWYPGSISHRNDPPAKADPKAPFMIGVIVEGESQSSSSSSSKAK